MSSWVVRRSAWKMWLLAMAGVPLTVFAVDLILPRRFPERFSGQGRIGDFLRDRLFNPEDTQLFEPRDEIWAWAMLVIGLGFVFWGLWELLFPTVIIRLSERAIFLRLTGPFRGSIRVPWEQVEDVGSSAVDDEGSTVPVVWLQFIDRTGLPDDPWGARWVDGRTLAVAASDWDRSAADVAEMIANYAYASASLPDEE